MTTIEIGNLYSKVIDMTPRAIVAVDAALAVETPGCKFAHSYKTGHWDGMTRFFQRKGKQFPTGLLSEVVIALRRIGEEPEIVDKRSSNIDYKLPAEIKLKHKELGSITLRDYQYDSVKKALEASRGVINVATNGGKTEIACGIIQTLLPNLSKDQKIVFFTHTKEIFTQSHKRIEERLGIKVGMVGSGKWDVQQVTVVMIPTIQKYIEKPKDLPKSKKLKDYENKVLTLQSAHRGSKDAEAKAKYKKQLEEVNKEFTAFKKEQWDSINDNINRTKEFLQSIAVFLGDEVHHASSDTWYKVFMNLGSAYYRFGLTGTVDEKDEINLKRLLGCTGKIITKISNEFLIENGHSAKPTIHLLSIDAEPIKDVNYMDARSLGIIHCKKRNEIFVEKVLERANFGKQCLIIVNETEHGEIVENMLKGSGVTAKFTHGERSDKFREQSLDELKDGSLRVLIATSILDEGVDVSGINCIFLMAGGKSMRQVLQRIGRGLRKKEDGSGVEVYDALDYHNEYLVDHTMERYKTYKNEGFEIVKL